ncbi:hypothetical protein ACFQ1M_07180 [Sungkyunkwania multivorans]|uniref:Uncharacterized protein n=1 Tax=Sungkyunkwania multivorans TaxID=1173618 RepID=A0ABW3CXE5_9FLAO
MTTITTIPVYNRRGKRVTSIHRDDFVKINDPEEAFFDVQENFVIIRDRFFRPPHLVMPWTFWIQGEKVSSQPLQKHCKKVLFILASPNRYEFDYSNEFKAGRPLSKKSFANFRETFPQLMQHLDGSGEECFEVTFYNMVPFQTSLFLLFKKSADKLTRFNCWLHGWYGMKYQREFEAFIKKNRFDYCFNASTKMFKKMVSQELSRHLSCEYQLHHPASSYWSRKKLNLGLKKIIHKETQEMAQWEQIDFDDNTFISR